MPPFENRSLETDAAIIASQAAARQLSVRGVRVGSGSPLTLAGWVENVTAIPLGPTGAQQIGMWRVDARITVELREAGRSEPLARVSVSDSRSFLPGSDIEATEVSRRLAVHHLLEKLSVTAVDRLNPK